MPTFRLIRRPEVEARSGYSTSTLYEEIATGKFPRPVKIGSRAVAWVESEIDEWIQQRIAERDSDDQKVLPKPIIEIAPRSDE